MKGRKSKANHTQSLKFGRDKTIRHTIPVFDRASLAPVNHTNNIQSLEESIKAKAR